MGVISAYMIIGLMFAAIYGAIYGFDGNTFFAQGAIGNSKTFQYFSFTTLTTLGYGDFTAATSGGRQSRWWKRWSGRSSSSPWSPAWSRPSGARSGPSITSSPPSTQRRGTPPLSGGRHQRAAGGHPLPAASGGCWPAAGPGAVAEANSLSGS